MRKWAKAKVQNLRVWGLATFYTYIGQSLLNLLLWTCRVEVRGLPGFVETVASGPTLMTIWHNRLSMMISMLLKTAGQFQYAAAISRSKDGNLIARVVDSYRQSRSIRVGHTAGHHALREIIHSLKEGEIVIVAPDGPRGPRYRLKPGLLFGARAVEAHIVPFTWVADRFWQFGSWDRMMIPKPFSRIAICFGPAIDSAEFDESGLEVLEERIRSWDKEQWASILPEGEGWPK
ncbi:MAG: DUF374 domain-containing protein [Chlamydiia bacterium]|nr:DUF374 domain-containing protein [Chlamydiia bacterium]